MSLFLSGLVNSAPIATDLLSFSFPDGWYVDRSKNDFMAVPNPNSSEFPSLVLEFCDYSKQSDCNITCNAETVHSVLFSKFFSHPSAEIPEYSDIERSDGYHEFRATGAFQNKTIWFSVSFICGKKGGVLSASQSNQSVDDAVARLNELINSIKFIE